MPRGNRQPPRSQAAICAPLRGAYSTGRWDSAALGTSCPDPAILCVAGGAEHRPWPLPLPRRQPALGKEPGRGKCCLGSGWKGVQGTGGAGHRMQLLLGIGAGSSAGLMGQQRCNSPCPCYALSLLPKDGERCLVRSHSVKGGHSPFSPAFSPCPMAPRAAIALQHPAPGYSPPLRGTGPALPASITPLPPLPLCLVLLGMTRRR